MGGKIAGSTIDDLLAREYLVSVLYRDACYTAAIDELSMAVRAPTLEEAWGELERRKREYFETMIAAGRADVIPRPTQSQAPREFWRAVAPFTFKATLAALLVALVGLSLTPAIKHQMRDLGREARVAGREFPRGLFDGLASFEGLNEERQQEVIAGIRRLLTSLEPVIAEARRILAAQAEDERNDPGGGAGGPPAQ